MFLLIDECCGKGLLAVAESHGHAVARTVETPGLGQGASDVDIFAYAAAAGAIVVTINQGDFLKLALGATIRPGLILLPSLRGAEIAKLFRQSLQQLRAAFEVDPVAVVRINNDGEQEIITPGT